MRRLRLPATWSNCAAASATRWTRRAETWRSLGASDHVDEDLLEIAPHGGDVIERHALGRERRGEASSLVPRQRLEEKPPLLDPPHQPVACRNLQCAPRVAGVERGE